MPKKTTVFSENLKHYRKLHKFTQQEFAKALGISRNTYAQYENAYYAPDLALLVKIAGHLSCSVTDLLTEHDEAGTALVPDIMERDREFLATYNKLDQEDKELFDNFLSFVEENSTAAKKLNTKAI